MITMLKEGLGRMDVRCSDRQAETLIRYLELLLTANTRINLTAIREGEAGVRLHLLDSAALLKAAPPERGDALLDVGTGGGLPGMVAAILRPDLAVTLCDATGKKVAFLREAIEALGLGGYTTAIQGRAEELARRPEYRDRFDYVTARAVAPLDQLAEYCLPLTRPGGIFAAMKGKKGPEELERARGAIALLGGARPELRPSPLVESEGCVIRIKKWRSTPAEYPRAGGVIRKRPLR